ncbi:hypothetical protein [Vulcanisaeta souniana]|uniref:Uncharacterized protein n=1 Tax=Vulcanisaeta souniana JCM 11219 TaxID=1293586 RepID=A0A830E3K4_9CREN|nr:hypothetical protein [Vulcanisaeta souniana]BDR92171.1 hypothetical protein Vsou_12640 [Vulcanisaeta souniana JCM 11219]GGI67372.1 hypothetical protein GCM10007112_00450 [Vulcanisaeta souniana JCM 11219]
MQCSEVNIVSRNNVREYLCGNRSLARLISHDNNESVLSIDVVAPWDSPVDQSIRVGDVQLIYRRETINNLEWEFVGYDDGSRRELISIRVFLGNNIEDSTIKELIINTLRTYMKDP